MDNLSALLRLRDHLKKQIALGGKLQPELDEINKKIEQIEKDNDKIDP